MIYIFFILFIFFCYLKTAISAAKLDIQFVVTYAVFFLQNIEPLYCGKNKFK